MSDALTQAAYAPAVARRMADAAERFVGLLSTAQREVACFSFAGDERYVWHYTPIERRGLPLKAMTHGQQEAAFALQESGLSARGGRVAEEIIALEPILKETERIEGVVTGVQRDSALYYVSVFGEPGGRAPWAWRVGGHHLGLHFTIVDGEHVAPTPLFFGANPAEVRHGEATGRRILAAEEDLARALLSTLDRDQLAIAVGDQTAPPDILSGNGRAVDQRALPSGIPYAALSGEQREHLVRLVRHYVERAEQSLAANAWSRIERDGLAGLSFSWAGALARGHGHYYAVKGTTFVIEYDNTQNEANHVHSVWRDATNDWGEDLLADHYRAAHHS